MGGGVIGVARGNIQQMSFQAHAALSGECNYYLSVLTKLTHQETKHVHNRIRFSGYIVYWRPRKIHTHSYTVSLLLCTSFTQYHQRWRLQRLWRGLQLETPPPSLAQSAEATPWAATPTDGCTTTLSLSAKIAACWPLISCQNPTLVSTAVRWLTLLDWVVVKWPPLDLEVSDV